MRRPPAISAGALVASMLLVQLHDPQQPDSYPICPWLALTSSYCPGCGGLRALRELTEGDLIAAASSNLLLVAALPLLMAWWCRVVVAHWTGRRHGWSPRVVNLVLLATIAFAGTFALLRNLAIAAWLAP